MKSPRFSHSFHAKVQPPPGEPCSTKEHYSGVMRELVGFLDDKAANDPTGERFVFTSVDYILRNKKCKRFKGEGYGKSAVYYAIEKLRKDRILSAPVYRERWMPSGKRGKMVLRRFKGSIMAPHVCLTVQDGHTCHMRGWLTNGRWDAAIPGDPNSIYWAGYAGGASREQAEAEWKVSGARVESVWTPSGKAVDTEWTPSGKSLSAHADEPKEVKPENRDQAFKAVQSVETALPEIPACPPKESKNTNTGRQAGDDFAFPLCEEKPAKETPEPSELERWQRFIDATENNLPEKLQNSRPTPKGIRAVLAQLDECGGDWYAARWLVFEIDDWAEFRIPKLDTLNAYVWGDGPNPEKHRFGWLKECTPGRIANAKGNAAGDRKRWGAAGYPYGKPNFLI
jgi:hypothetical protein